MDPEAFILAWTTPTVLPDLPGLRLHLANELGPLWQATTLQSFGLAPPYWAFAWPGGLGIARFLLAQPEQVRGRRVLDLGAGSGLVGLTAVQGGARSVLAADIDPHAGAACRLNARLNGLALDTTTDDLLDVRAALPFDVILAGDLLYEQPMAGRVLTFLAHQTRHGARVLLGDPRRTFFPTDGLRELTRSVVSASLEIEARTEVPTGVWTIDEPGRFFGE